MRRLSHLRVYLLISVLVPAPAVCQQFSRDQRSPDKIHFKYSTLQVPGSSTTIAYGINNHGDIVGYTDVGTAGFLYSDGAFHTVACPGVPFTVASAINDSGVIAGYCGTDATQGFILQDGTFTYVAYPGAASTLLFGVNNQGEVVGQYLSDKPPHYRAFVYSNGVFTRLAGSAANTIVSEDAIAGQGCQQHVCSGVIFTKPRKHWKRSGFVLYPGAKATILNGMNDSGDLAGFWAPPDSETNQGFVYLKDQDSFASITIKKNQTTEIFSINNSDEFVGYYTSGNKLYGFYAQVKR